MLRNLCRAVVLVALVAAAPGVAFAQTTPTPTPTPTTPAVVPDPSDPFFSDATLQDINLTINTRDWQSLRDHFLDNTYYPCNFTWKGQVVRNIGIRSRGTGSRSGVKPGLRLDFDRYTTDQTFLGLKSFILRNNTQDPSGMRERLSMELFKRMGMVAEREAHARLLINGVYFGLYTIVESIDKTFLQKQFNENDGHLYEYSFDNASTTPFTFNYLGSDPSSYTPSPFKPETLTTDPQGEVLERLFWTVNVAGDAVWRDSMEEFLDMKKFIRHLAIENFLGEQDGITGDYGPNNFYFYRFVNTNKYMFLPWDKSNTFWASPDYAIFHNIDDGSGTDKIWNRLVQRAMKDTELRELYLNTMLEAADSILLPPESTTTPPTTAPPANPATPVIGWLESEVTRMSDQIRAAEYVDTSREVYTNADWDESIRFLTNWAKVRSGIVRAQVAADRARRGIK